MKKFKKNKKTSSEVSKDKEDISSLYYWGEDNDANPRNILIAASWDGRVRLYDDSTAEREGTRRYTMKKHRESVNFIDFDQTNQLCASCSDDGSIVIYNYGSYRQEGVLKVPPTELSEEAEVKVCKFLVPYNCLVSSDLDGYLHFWAVTPSSRKNELLCSVKDDNISEVGTKVNFPIRAIDFDSKRKLLFTGDEMGYMHKWDLGKLIEKLDRVKE
jgi:WD40 repeat protein